MCKRTIRFVPVMILFVLAVALYAAHLRALPVTASLQSVTGDVQIMLPGGSWQPGTVNMSLPSGTQIKTGAKSSATVKWSSSNTLKINPFTNFTIKDIDIDPRTKTVTSNLDLMTGKVKAKAEKLHNPSSEFSISTPTAVAGVRGTEFDMENTPENTTSVTTRTGSVEVMSQGQSVMAVPGTQVVVQPNQPPAPPVPISNEEMNACEVDEDCMSHKCVDGQCEGEESAMQSGGCRVIEAACTTGKDCCSGNCADGVCAEKAADQTAAACIPNGSACKAGDECCSKNCGVGGVCVAPPAASGSETATGTVAVATSDEEDADEEEEEVECFVELSKPEDGGSYPLTKGTVTVSGKTIAGATCVLGGASVTAGSEGAFTSEFTLASAGDTTVSVICSNSDGTCKAEAKVTIDAVAPPKLEISNPIEGFMQCPWIPISGMTDPGTNVYINGTSIKGNPKATIGADGSFALDGFYQQDCTKPIEFVANDQFGQTSRLVINSGATTNAAAMGVNIQNVDVLLVPSGVWVNGQTSVQAVATAKSSTPFSGALTVTFTDGNGAFLGSRTLMPIAGATAAREDGSSAARTSGQTGASNAYYAQARMTIFSGPANPLIVRARIGDISASVPAENAIVLRGIVCTRTAMVVGDGIDNDCDGRIDEDPVDGLDNDGDGIKDEDSPAIGAKCDSRLSQTYCDTLTNEQAAQIGMKCDNRIDDDRDGRVDEESPDGIDNDGDGLIDEDLKCVCDPTDQYADCDLDGLRNGLDCNANKWESAPVRRDSALCAVSCNAQALPDGDCDGDGLLNAQEMALGTDPYKKDTDGDNYTDLQEVQAGTDPRKAEDNPGTRTYQTVTPSAAVCVGGQIKTPEGNCICPSGTMWSSSAQSCLVASFAQCASNQYFDAAVGGCVSSCTGGQVADSSIGRCYCATGFLGAEGYCLPACPTGMTGDPATRACVCQTGLYYDVSSNGCFATCSGGQVIDPVMKQCVCPTGTSLSATTRTCVANASATICPTGTAGAGCDFAIASRDCDADGILNVNDANPCVNETGVVVTESGTFQRLCPEGTDAVGCDLMTNPDCDLDGAPNTSDQCPCRVGTAATNYCPTVAVTCPTGQYLDQFYGTCHTTCPAPKIGDPANMRCVCGPGTALDINTGQCVSSCPVGMIMGQNGECVCGPNAPLMDQFTAACSANCSGGQVTNPETPGMCVCPQGYGPNFTTKQCVINCPAGMIAGANGCVCGPSAPYMDPFNQGCLTSCTGGTAANDPAMPGMCMCPQGTYPDYATGQCKSSCPDGMVFSGGNCVCGGSTPFMDPFLETCVASCTGGAVADDPEMPGMCMCPEGTYPDQAAGECMSICPDGMVYSEGSCVCGGSTPFMDPFIDGCSAECTGGTVEDPMMPGFCVCPQGTNPDFGLMECVSVFDPCEIYGDPGMCETDANCFWDTSKSRCNFDGGICGAYDMSACMSNTEDCYWNAAEMVCLENSGKVYCGAHTYEECNMDPACQWNMDFCGEAQGEISCGEILNDVDCSNTMGCMWDGMYCVMDMGGSCSQYVNSGICDQTPGCSWDYDFGVCEDVIDECAAYSDMPSCNGDMSCGWNNYAGTCFSLEGDCTDIHSNDMDCVADERCEWNSMSNTCVFKMSEVCSTYTDMGMCEMQQGCMWDGTYCIDDMGPDCSMIYNDVDCTNTMGCMWDGMYCVTDGGGSTCPMMMDESSCNATMGCYWNGTMCMQDMGPDCSMIYNDVDCGNTMGCMWDGTYCVEDMGGPECWNILNESTCNATMDCLWDGTYCIEDVVNPECWNNTDEFSCNGMMGCMWDGTACVQDMGPDCSMIYNDIDCANTMGCMWDGMYCVTDGGGSTCPMMMDESSCNATMGCYWNGAMCMQDMGPDCSMIYNDVDCVNTMGCMWDGMYCVADGGGCGAILDMSMCQTTPGCSWDAMYGECFEVIDDCAAYQDMPSCSGDMSCGWNNYAGNCFSLEGDCTDIHLNDMDCVADERCEWNAMSTTCVFKMSEVCFTYTDMNSCNTQQGCLWDDVEQICVQDIAPPECFNIFNPMDCDNTFGCMWDGMYAQCVQDFGDVCSLHENSIDCNNDANCYYDGVNGCEMLDNGGNCGFFGSDQVLCELHSTYCQWNTYGDGYCEAFDPGPGCYNYPGEFDCDAAPGCYWSAGETACLEIIPGECWNYTSQTQCGKDYLCTWDVDQCVVAGGPDCSMIYNDIDCANTMGCMWDGMYCVQDMGPDCSMIYNDVDCGNTMGCYWNGYAWVEDMGPHCSMIYNDVDCGNTMGCYWNGYACVEDMGPDCSMIYNDVDCANTMGCMWDGYQCVMDMGGADCWNIYNDIDCNGTMGCYWDGYNCNMDTGNCYDYYSESFCENNENCYWNGYSCTDDLGCESYTISDCYYNGCEWNDYYGQCLESGTGCAAFNGDEYSCGSSFDCYWDAGNQLCVAQCGVGLHWNGYQCEEDTGTCADYFEYNDCNATTGCYWDGYGSNQCQTLVHGSQCEAYGFEYSCNQNPDFCEWYSSGGPYGNCGPIAVDCSAYEEFGGPNACIASSLECEWNFNNGTCVPEGMAGCGVYENNGDCDAQVGSCEWNYNESICVNFGTAGCASYGWDESTACDNEPYCVWDSYYGVCNTQWDLLCGSYTEPTSCNMDFGCVWNPGDPGNCMEMNSEMYCSTFMDDASCEVHSAYCNWYSASNVCAEAYYECGYYSQTDPATCNSDPDCEWFYGEEFCANQGDAGCFKYGPSDQVACDEDAMCAWNGYMCDQDQGAVCSQYYDINTCNWEGCFWYGDHCGANPCMDQNDPYACNESPYCYWSYEYCEAGEDSGEPCSALSISYCDAYGGGGICNWHEGDMSYCEPAGGIPDCSLIYSDVDCANTMGCMWDGYQCVMDMGGPDCSAIFNDVDCGNTLGCMWDGTYCVEDMGGSACGENLTLEACNTDSSCVWDDVNTECVQFDGVASCNKFADQMYCENHSVDCKWYAGLMTCDGNTYGCGYYEFATVEQCNMDVDCDYNHNTDMCMEAGTAGCGEFGDSNTNCNAQTGNCEWNYSDNHCVPFDTAGCSKYGPLDESMCSGDPNCDWDTDHCIESVPAGCSLFDTDATCNAEATCIWIGSTCEDMASGSQCTLLSMQGDCESHTSFCNWYSGLNLCGDIADGCGFYGFGAMACNADTDCEYNFNMPGCVEFGTAGCGKHENDSMCIGDPMCTWNGTNCIPSGPPACNTYMDQFTCQNNSCTWVSGQCGGMGQTWCSSSYIAQGINCYTYMDQSPCEAQNGCVWNLTECVDASANDCNMDLSCMWNGPMSTCIEDMSNQCMMTYGGDQFGCNMATTCNWQPGQCGP